LGELRKIDNCSYTVTGFRYYILNLYVFSAKGIAERVNLDVW